MARPGGFPFCRVSDQTWPLADQVFDPSEPRSRLSDKNIALVIEADPRLVATEATAIMVCPVVARARAAMNNPDLPSYHLRQAKAESVDAEEVNTPDAPDELLNNPGRT